MRDGFTLIEMIVTIAIILVMVGGGITAYISFNDRQTIQSAGKQLLIALRSAQTKARVGDRPDLCDRLTGYAVRGGAGTGIVQVVAQCESGEFVRDEETLPSGVTFAEPLDVVFGVLAGGVTHSGNYQLTTGQLDYQVTITPGGELYGGLMHDE